MSIDIEKKSAEQTVEVLLRPLGNQPETRILLDLARGRNNKTRNFLDVAPGDRV